MPTVNDLDIIFFQIFCLDSGKVITQFPVLYPVVSSLSYDSITIYSLTLFVEMMHEAHTECLFTQSIIGYFLSVNVPCELAGTLGLGLDARCILDRLCKLVDSADLIDLLLKGKSRLLLTLVKRMRRLKGTILE